MSVIVLIVLLCVLGGIWWLIDSKGSALNPTFKLVIKVVLIVVAVVLVLSAFGVWDELKSLKVPKL